MEDRSNSDARTRLLAAIDQALKEEDEKEQGKWTKLYQDLSEVDRENLQKSASNLMRKFITNNPTDLPDIVLLPEISARPLFYLLNPIFKALSERRQIKAPTFVYFQTHKVPKKFDPILLNTSKEIMRSRAEEIKNYAELVGITNPKIVIFDDYVTQHHTSIDEIRNAFGSAIPAYCLLQERGVDFSDDTDIFTGMEDPYGTTAITTSQGFEYRNKYEGNRHAIGVEKDRNGKYVEASRFKNYASMQNLRSGLQQIGQKITQEVLP